MPHLLGGRPAEVRLPTKFELLVNLKTAKALGFFVPRRRCYRIKVLHAAAREASYGPLRLFAVVQDDARNGRLSGRSSDVASTAVPDPKRLLQDEAKE
jgi:hypothetical protein